MVSVVLVARPGALLVVAMLQVIPLHQIRKLVVVARYRRPELVRVRLVVEL